MDKQELATIARALVAPGKGLLLIDERNRTCKNRFEEVGIAPTEENHRAYRELILTSPGLGTFSNNAARQGKYSKKMEQTVPALVGSEGPHSHLSSQD